MLKPKSKSLVIAEPLPDELKEHIMMLEQRQFEIVRQKLQRQQEKQERVNALEREFVDWADRKEQIIRGKLQKSTKNKQDYLSKVVKKCKDHEKYIGEKLKIYKTKKRDNLKQAWKKAEQFNSNIEEYHTSKHVSKDRSAPKFKTDHNQTESRIVDKQQIFYEREPQKEYLSVSYNNASKFIDNTSKNLMNPSKEYWGQLNQSIKLLKQTEQLPQIENEQRRQKNQMVNIKLKQTLARFRQFVQCQQQQKIQQLGQRLQKIEKTRQKKIQMFKKKTTNQHTIDDDANQRNSPKKKVNRSQRVNSESQVNQRRGEDWSFPNKKKREELFQMSLQQGTEYLQHQKLKYMKTSLTRKIVGSAIQKKLYFQRLNH